MWELFLDFVRVVRRRDSQSAVLMIIGLGAFLSLQDTRQMAEYFQSMYEADKRSK